MTTVVIAEDEAIIRLDLKETLESEDFYFLVKNKIEKTGSLLNLTNQ